jgi:hypothetical protein
MTKAIWMLGLATATGCYAGVPDDETGQPWQTAGDAESGDSGASASGSASSASGSSASDGNDTSGSTVSDGSASGQADTSGDGTSGDDATTSDSGQPDPNDSAAQYCVDVINMYRATLNLPPYDRWVEAEACSDEEAAMDAASGQPHGAFGMCGESAQNECPGWGGSLQSVLDGCLAAMWAEGPGEDFQQHGHYINMSSTQYSKVACGFHETQGGEIWAVQNFN